MNVSITDAEEERGKYLGNISIKDTYINFILLIALMLRCCLR